MQCREQSKVCEHKDLYKQGDSGQLLHVEILAVAVGSCSSPAPRPAGNEHMKAFSPVTGLNSTS